MTIDDLSSNLNKIILSISIIIVNIFKITNFFEIFIKNYLRHF